MSAATDFLENAIVTTYFKTGTITLALYITPISDGGVGTEVAGGSYVKTAFAFGVNVDGVVSNAADVIFEDMPACTVVAGAVFNGANMMAKNNFSIPRVVVEGSTFVVPAGEVIVRVR